MPPEQDSPPAKAIESFEQALRATEARCPFGPSFFATHLRKLIRDHCPDPNESMPLVEIHLLGGEVLDVCHIIGLGPAWLALAVFERSAKATPQTMRTELVPYGTVMRITISQKGAGESRIGFNLAHTPFVVHASAIGTGPGAELLKLAETPEETAPEK